MLVIGSLLVVINSFLKILLYLNAIMIEIGNFVKGFVARLRGILLFSEIIGLAVELHGYLNLVWDVLMQFCFITYSHLV